jgi:formate hydrogenlyase subunit 3/multisubunit Na+/H+ antiporter MnhD subunit
MVEIGLSLLAISMGLGPDGNGTTLSLFFALLPPRAISLGVWALALIVISSHRTGGSQIEEQPSGWELSFREMHGAARQYPVAACCLMLAQFSLAGLPLLAGFPIRLAIWDWLVQQSVPITGVVLLGYAGLMIAGIRTMTVLVTGKEDVGWKIHEQRSENLLLIAGGLVIILIGLFPQVYTPAMVNVAEVFYQIIP